MKLNSSIIIITTTIGRKKNNTKITSFSKRSTIFIPTSPLHLANDHQRKRSTQKRTPMKKTLNQHPTARRTRVARKGIENRFHLAQHNVNLALAMLIQHLASHPRGIILTSSTQLGAHTQTRDESARIDGCEPRWTKRRLSLFPSKPFWLQLWGAR